MTHYRLSLTKGRYSPKPIAERHSFSSAIPGPWYNSLLASRNASVHVRICWDSDDECPHLFREPPAPLPPEPTR